MLGPGGMPAGGLRLEVAEWVSPSRWRWVLRGPGGEFLADHEVDLDAAGGRGTSEWEGFTDLEWFLRWRAAIDRRLDSEAELVAEVGDWITARVLGPRVARVLADRGEPVQLVIPPGAQVLAYRPWQAARVDGRALAASNVTFVTSVPRSTSSVSIGSVKRPVGDKLRMLAVFSLPEDAAALNLRRERYALARLVNDIATVNGRGIELRVLQYGATRARLREALRERPGWDIVHVSGHGLPAGLVLEDETGHRDKISTGDLVELIRAGRDQIKLITLSACESAALTAADHLRLLGLTPTPGTGTGGGGVPGLPEQPEHQEDQQGRDAQHGLEGSARQADPAEGAGGDGPVVERLGERGERSWGVSADGLPGSTAGPTDAPVAAGSGRAPARSGDQAGGGLSVLATALVDRIDAGVLAMRYPVVDDFAIGLAERFYDLVLAKGQPVDRALGLALEEVIERPSPGVPALSVATPALFGARAVGLELTAPEGEPLVFEAERVKLARFLEQPSRFVGRVGPLTRASTVLAPRSGVGGVVFHGMAGAGKTACALELAYTHQDGFQLLVWHQGPLQDQDITSAFTNLALDLEAQIPGLRLVHLVDDVAALRAFLPTLTEFLHRNRVLIVLDNLESVLTSAGGWRDERWRLLVEAVTVPTGGSRVVLTSRVRPTLLPAGLVVEAVHALSLAESVLLAREWPHLKALIDTPDRGRDDRGSGRGLAARTLAVVQGHPKLIELADGQAADPTVLAARLDEVDQTWLTRGVRLEGFLQQGESQASDQDYYAVLAGWTRATTGRLPAASGVLFTVLAGLENDDRTPFVLDDIWPVVWRELGYPDPAPGIEVTVRPLVEQALAAVDTDPDTGGVVGYRIHPGVAEATRSHTPSDHTRVIDTKAAAFWQVALWSGLEREAEGMGPLILRAARSAAPYLARHQDWATLADVLAQVLVRDFSPATAAVLLPYLAAAAHATAGTDQDIRCGFTHARALGRGRPDQAVTALAGLLDAAHQRGDHHWASVIAGELVNQHQEAGRYDDALAVVDQLQADTRAAGHGPWTQLAVEDQRL